MSINLKYFLIPYLAFSLTTAYASFSESSDDEGEPIGSPFQAEKDPMGGSEGKEESASTPSGPKVLCGHKPCQEKLDARLRGEASGLEGVSRVNIIDSSLVPSLAVDTESDSEDSVEIEES
ncbi:MAG TPA: hypothetical protein DD412_05520 [Holosporales bacterium]|nr:hypothetical protein [Holosporales bacterium]